MASRTCFLRDTVVGRCCGRQGWIRAQAGEYALALSRTLASPHDVLARMDCDLSKLGIWSVPAVAKAKPG